MILNDYYADFGSIYELTDDMGETNSGLLTSVRADANSFVYYLLTFEGDIIDWDVYKDGGLRPVSYDEISIEDKVAIMERLFAYGTELIGRDAVEAHKKLAGIVISKMMERK